MIRHKLSSLRHGAQVYQVPVLVPKTTEPVASPPLAQPAAVVHTLMHEAARRDKIVQDLYKLCPYMEGDVCQPTEPEWVERYGSNITVEKICTRYSHMGPSEKWPDDDNPLTVQAWSNDKSERFFCTTNFLKKV